MRLLFPRRQDLMVEMLKEEAKEIAERGRE
jgi:hypothetical protein